jgi:hypothetical protein
MALTITKEQRDVIYDHILSRISGIGDIWLAVGAKNYEDAQRLGREYGDDLRLMDDLGWGEGAYGSIELTTAPDVLRRALSRVHDSATSHTASKEDELLELREMEESNRVAVEVCRAVLADLDAAGDNSQ